MYVRISVAKCHFCTFTVSICTLCCELHCRECVFHNVNITDFTVAELSCRICDKMVSVISQGTSYVWYIHTYIHTYVCMYVRTCVLTDTAELVVHIYCALSINL